MSPGISVSFRPEKFRDVFRGRPDARTHSRGYGAGVSAREVNLQLRIEPDAISGSMMEPGGAPAPFVGWLGLISAIERVQVALTTPEPAVEPEPEETHD
jgi:hypothetical protein